MKHLMRASVPALVLTLAAFGLSACGPTRDDDCDETTRATAQFAVAPELGSKPKPPKATKPRAGKPKKGASGSKTKNGKTKNGKPKASKPKVSHHDDDCDED